MRMKEDGTNGATRRGNAAIKPAAKTDPGSAARYIHYSSGLLVWFWWQEGSAVVLCVSCGRMHQQGKEHTRQRGTENADYEKNVQQAQAGSMRRIYLQGAMLLPHNRRRQHRTCTCSEAYTTTTINGSLWLRLRLFGIDP